MSSYAVIQRRPLPRLLAAAFVCALVWTLAGAGGAAGQNETDLVDVVCPDGVEPAPFEDRDAVPAVHQRSVDCAAERGIVAGFTDGTFRPGVQVRRDQLASFVYRVLQEAEVVLPEPDPDRFTDVDPDSVHDEAIHVLKAIGVAQGGAGGADADEFVPGLLMRRDQLVSFLARPLAYADPDLIELNQQQQTRFSDVPESNVHSGNIEQSAELGIVQGFADGTFRPDEGVRRDQMASFMIRLFVALPKPPPFTGLRLQAEAPGARIGSTVAVTATVAVEGEPVEGAEVTFAASGAAVEPTEGTGVTDAQGETVFQITSAEEGLVTVTGETTVGEATYTDVSTVQFTRPVRAATWVDLQPPSATVPIDGTHTVTVTAGHDHEGEALLEPLIALEVHVDNPERDRLTLPRIRKETARTEDGTVTFTFPFGPDEDHQDVELPEDASHQVVVACVVSSTTANCNDAFGGTGLRRNPGGTSDDWLNITSTPYDTAELVWE